MGKLGWIWRKGVLAALVLVFSAPFLVPPLVVAFISSLPCCFYLASYVCTEKLMRKLLPATAFGGRGEKMVIRVPMSEPIFVQTEEDDTTPLRVTNIVFDVRKESKSLLDSIRDDGRTNQSLDREKDFRKESITNKSDKVGARVGNLSRKKKVSGTIHEGVLVESTTKEASRGKDMEESSNEMKVLYSEEQIWAKMETLRKIVGYNVARSTTVSEELKALHMFMGVEFPTTRILHNKLLRDFAFLCPLLESNKRFCSC